MAPHLMQVMVEWDYFNQYLVLILHMLVVVAVEHSIK
jgi:hypothetical protein